MLIRSQKQPPDLTQKLYEFLKYFCDNFAASNLAYLACCCRAIDDSDLALIKKRTRLHFLRQMTFHNELYS